MAAYASLVSVMHIIDDLQFHPRPPITLHKEQAHLLTQKVAFLQEFLQVYNPNLPYSKEADPLESRIARAAYAAEDAIESHIADQFTGNDGENMSSDGLYEALEKVIEDMALIEKEAVEIKETPVFRNQLHAKSTPPDSSKSTSSSSIFQKQISMVGANDVLLELKSMLTSDARDLQVIPIVGMGGTGKSTLALNIYKDGLIEEHFDILALATISQEYRIRDILIQVLSQLIKNFDRELGEGELVEMLYKHLYGKRFMIILDDMWSIKAWDEVRKFIPKDKKGSRIVITTRLATLASELTNSNILRMNLLDEDDSWDLLTKTVFGEKGVCPLELEKIGKKIGKNCKGLPLSIVVVGGLLAKSEQTIESWEKMEQNLTAIVNLEDDERCLKILYMSYKHLPVHLKPCFLYMGIFHEDRVIRISELIRLWVAEGFLKPINGKSLEDIARVYLEDLSSRNLVLIHKMGSIGGIKECKVHDLFRDMCIREAQKEGFYSVFTGQGIVNGARRIVMSSDLRERDALSSVPLARSLILKVGDRNVPTLDFRMLRVLGSCNASQVFIETVHQLVNSRYFNFTCSRFEFPSSIWLLWNLQTLIVTKLKTRSGFTAPIDIWYMSHIRHLYFDALYLPDPPSAQDGIVLENLQSLGRVLDFTFSEEVVRRIPNIKRLKIFYTEADERFCLTNLARLHKLESLFCFSMQLPSLITYPHSIKKLSLGVLDPECCWEEVLDKIGSLPLLQKLRLVSGSFKEGHWETTQGHFRSLKFLHLYKFSSLEQWTAESSHFPCLEHLGIHESYALTEIPQDFAEISTLGMIDLDDCRDSVIESAKRILQAHEELYGEDETTLQIHVQLRLTTNDPELGSLRSRNFHVRGSNDFERV